jgi:hypothetical protein
MTIQINILTNKKSGDIFELRKCLRFSFRGVRLAVPSGFKSDGASVPRMFWRLVFPPLDRNAIRAAILHDYLYRKDNFLFGRKDADALFLGLMILDGVKPHRAYLAYLGVRLFGSLSWRQK